MAVEEIFKKLEKKTKEISSARQPACVPGTQQGLFQFNQSCRTPQKKELAGEVIWFSLPWPLVFFMGYLFYELFSAYHSEVKKILWSYCLTAMPILFIF